MGIERFKPLIDVPPFGATIPALRTEPAVGNALRVGTWGDKDIYAVAMWNTKEQGYVGDAWKAARLVGGGPNDPAAGILHAQGDHTVYAPYIMKMGWAPKSAPYRDAIRPLTSSTELSGEAQFVDFMDGIRHGKNVIRRQRDAVSGYLPD